MSKNDICTFCDKHYEKVETLVVSDNANICNECIEVCSYIVETYQKPKADSDKKNYYEYK